MLWSFAANVFLGDCVWLFHRFLLCKERGSPRPSLQQVQLSLLCCFFICVPHVCKAVPLAFSGLHICVAAWSCQSKFALQMVKNSSEYLCMMAFMSRRLFLNVKLPWPPKLPLLLLVCLRCSSALETYRHFGKGNMDILRDRQLYNRNKLSDGDTRANIETRPRFLFPHK